jgi:eukaryotic translation initiation factor 2C
MEPANYKIGFDVNTDEPKYQFTSDLPNRPGLNSQGKQITIRINQFKVTAWPSMDVYQYDVSKNFTFTWYYANKSTDFDWYWC